ncbi:MAG: hypothetical protein ACMUIG_01390 [Thermoplasmatota archaeon]
MNAEIENIVMRANLGCTLDLDRLSRGFEGSEFDPEKFPGMIYRMEDVRIAALLFTSGNMVITGARDLESAGKTFRKLVERISDMGFPVNRDAEPVVQDLVLLGDIGRKVELSELDITDSGPTETYNPDEYPGLIISASDGRMSMILMPSGKVVITGGTDLEKMSRELDSLMESIKDDN